MAHIEKIIEEIEASTPTVVTWTAALIGSIAVGLSGVVPILLIPLDHNPTQSFQADKNLKLLLSFAVGGLLGDVFLHLFPEAYGALEAVEDPHSSRLNLGLWILGGILAFLILEKIFEFTEEKNRSQEDKQGSSGKKPKKDILGYLNLIANCIDNFLHGLTVASSFLTSIKLGMVTTLAILLHEIPHEVGDFAILLRSGFTRWEAGKAQMWTASIGVLGALSALSLDSVQSLEARTAWILPFSAGGFLNIALVSILPELMSETNPVEATKQLACMFAGIIVMGLLSSI